MADVRSPAIPSPQPSISHRASAFSMPSLGKHVGKSYICEKHQFYKTDMTCDRTEDTPTLASKTPAQFSGYGIWIMTIYFSVKAMVWTGEGYLCSMNSAMARHATAGSSCIFC